MKIDGVVTARISEYPFKQFGSVFGQKNVTVSQHLRTHCVYIWIQYAMFSGDLFFVDK